MRNKGCHINKLLYYRKKYLGQCQQTLDRGSGVRPADGARPLPWLPGGRGGVLKRRPPLPSREFREGLEAETERVRLAVRTGKDRYRVVKTCGRLAGPRPLPVGAAADRVYRSRVRRILAIAADETQGPAQQPGDLEREAK